MNAYLDCLQNKVFEAHRQLAEKDEIITAEKLRNHFQGKLEKQYNRVAAQQAPKHRAACNRAASAGIYIIKIEQALWQEENVDGKHTKV